MTINNKFKIDQIVFLITDLDQSARMVTGIKVTNNGLIYYLSFGTVESVHYESEIAEEKKYI